MSTHWNFEKQEKLKEHLEAAHKVAKDYLSNPRQNTPTSKRSESGG